MSKKPELWAIISDRINWMVVDIISGRKRIIGRINANRTNNYDNAAIEAMRRNKRATGRDGYIFISEWYTPTINLKKYLNEPLIRGF